MRTILVVEDEMKIAAVVRDHLEHAGVRGHRHGRRRGSDLERAGACFSPSGDTLYVNIQASSALTFAIWGRWTNGPL